MARDDIPVAVEILDEMGQVVDLQTGSRVGIQGLEIPPTFSPDERAIFARRFGQLIAIDTETGDTAVLPAPIGAPSFFNAIPLLQSN